MTDLPIGLHHVPSRLGVTLALAGDQIIGHLSPVPAMCDRGVMPLAPLVFLVDAVAGVAMDTDPDTWAFTSDLSIRVPLGASPRQVEARSTTLRAGRRSITCEVALTTSDGSWGTCLIGFATVPRRPDDPPKPQFDVAEAIAAWARIPPLTEPLRAAMPVESIDPAAGVASVARRPELLNPAGALQGAMVSFLAEAAAEDLADHHLGREPGVHVVTEMEVRFLAQNRGSSIVSRARFVGAPEDGLVRVDLVDDDTGRLTTAVLTRVRRAPADTRSDP